MKKYSKKLAALALVALLSCSTAFLTKEKKCINSQAIAGIGYLMARKGCSAEVGFGVALAGIYEGAVQGLCWGAAFGNAAGAAAGAVVGL